MRGLNKKTLGELDEVQRHILLRVVKNIYIRKAKSFLPKDAASLLRTVIEQVPVTSRVK